MKTKRIIFLGSLCCSIIVQANDNFTNVIEMVELGADGEPPLLWTMPGNIAAKGNNVLVGQALPEAGAIFILRTIQGEPFHDHFLASTSVGAYLPQATVEITTHDTESLTKRTRADQPINVKVTVSGLYDSDSPLDLPDDVVQLAAREVTLQNFSEDYPVDSTALLRNEITSASKSDLTLVGNGVHEFTYYTSLNSAAPDLARGEEHYIVRSEKDGSVSEAALDREELQVWPVWSGGQSGLNSPALIPYQYSGGDPQIVATSGAPLQRDETFVLQENETGYDYTPPNVTFTWNDLYPTSTIGIIVNDASIPYPWGGRWVDGSKLNSNYQGSTSHTHTVTNWEGVLGGQGRYAVWIVTNTPGIGWEVGGNYVNGELQEGGWAMTIKKDTITVRASVQSLQ